MSLRGWVVEILVENHADEHFYVAKLLEEIADEILAAVAEAAEKGMPTCPPMNDREDIAVSLMNQRQACINWLKGEEEP